jgi:diacylglycerol kinase (ATP)
MHTVVIVNPSSAGGRTGKSWRKLSALVREAYGDFEDCFTQAPGDGTRLARQAIREGARTIVAVGGDGSVNDIVNGFFEEADPGQDAKAVRAIDPDAALGIIPLGTGGDFIRSLGIPRDPAEAARALLAATPRRIDVGRVSYIDHDGKPGARYYVNVASFGIAGLVDKYVNASRKRLSGTLAFGLATLRAGIAYKNSPVRVRVDGGEWKIGPIYNVSIANARFFGGGMKVAPDALLDDGVLDFVRFGDMGLLDIVRDGMDLYSGKHVELAEVSTAKVTSVEAEAADGREVLLDVDGEQPGRLPARFDVIPGAIHLRAPELPR